MISLLKIGGVWGCPAGFSSWIKTSDTSMTFDGPLNDDDKLPDLVPADLAEQAIQACMNTNRRIVVCLAAISVRVIGKDDTTITPNPKWSL